MLLVSRCPGCGADGAAPCRRCGEALGPSPVVPAITGVDRLWALAAYEGVGRELVVALKFRNTRSVVGWLAHELAELVECRPQLVTWVPASPGHRRNRGYDQGRLLARAIARRLRVPCRRLARRLPGPAQTERTRAERLTGPDLWPVRAAPLRVLVVDDVVTTGTSIAAMAALCRAAGAARVDAVVVAVTPDRSR